jgi:hypothetical protein
MKQNTATMVRNLDVALSILTVLESVLEDVTGNRDLHYMASLAGEGKRKLEEVIDGISG